MSVLRVAAASFTSEAGDAVGPLDFSLKAGEHRVLSFSNGRQASIAARLCAAIVKPTCGSIYICHYDTRLQPPQAKRLVGFVDVAGSAGDRHTFDCEVAFRAEVWGLEVSRARIRARETLAAVGDETDPYARALALALVPEVALLVFDQPAHPRYRARIAETHPQTVVVETRVGSPAPILLEARDFVTAPS
jgi:ABC-type multidrug transport system ATPase subunit